MNKKHELKKYPATKIGYDLLSLDDYELAINSRSVAMTFLEQYYLKGTLEEKENGYKDLFALANLIGFKVSYKKYFSNGEMMFSKRFPSYRDGVFFKELFARFENEVRLVGFDPNDEHGLFDESVNIANIALKYRRLIALKLKRKSVFENIFQYFKNKME